MRQTMLVLAVMTWSCGGGSSSTGTRYFRVLFPQAGTGASLPDGCYQPMSLPGPMNADEIAAQSYCSVGKKPTASGSTTERIVVAQPWTMVDVGEGKLYLVASQGSTSVGIEGSVTNDTYSFSGKVDSFTKQCAGAGLPVGTSTECNGACVNTRSDPANCGTCGVPCATGQSCRLGMCSSMMCPAVMQTCAAVMVNTQTDDANCGFCGRVCGTGETCSGGNCVSPCAAVCSDKYSAAGCGAPRQFSRSVTNEISFKLNGGTLTGTSAQTTAYACTAPGCSADFAQRCPTCAQPVSIVGREVFNVTEFEAR